MSQWFVNTRGSRADEDYGWRHIGDASAAPEAYDVLERGWQGTPALTLVDDQRPGLLLFSEERLVLLVTGLIHPSRPRDYQNRPIRIGLLGVGRPGELVGVAVRALRDELAEQIPITYGTRGYELDQDAWAALLRRAADPEPGEADPWHDSLLPDDDGSRRSVAAQLAALHAQDDLAEMTGRIILLRTNLLDRPRIYKLAPWRCLSDVTETVRIREAPTESGSALEVVAKSLLRDVGRVGRKGIDAGWQRLFPASALVLAGAVLGVVALTWTGSSGPARGPSPRPSPATPFTPSAESPSVLVNGPAAPAGVISAGDWFTVTWKLRNAGAEAWNGRYLRRTPKQPDSAVCASEPRAAIPYAGPRQVVTVTVWFLARRAGDCHTRWKVTDDKGHPVFPGSAGLVFHATVAAG